jgi:hypothetical protein
MGAQVGEVLGRHRIDRRPDDRRVELQRIHADEGGARRSEPVQRGRGRREPVAATQLDRHRHRGERSQHGLEFRRAGALWVNAGASCRRNELSFSASRVGICDGRGGL